MKSNKDSSETDFKKNLYEENLNPDCRIEVLWNQLDYELIELLRNN